MARRRRYRRNPSTTDLLVLLGVAGAGYLLYQHLKVPTTPPLGPMVGTAPATSAGASTIASAIEGAFGKWFSVDPIAPGPADPSVTPQIAPSATSGLGYLGSLS